MEMHSRKISPRQSQCMQRRLVDLAMKQTRGRGSVEWTDRQAVSAGQTPSAHINTPATGLLRHAPDWAVQEPPCTYTPSGSRAIHQMVFDMETGAHGHGASKRTGHKHPLGLGRHRETNAPAQGS